MACSRRDYSVTGTTLTFVTTPPNGSAIVAWDIVGGGIVPYDIGIYFPASPGPAQRSCSSLPRGLHAACGRHRQPGLCRDGADRLGRCRDPKNGGSIGTVTFAASTGTATYAFARPMARRSVVIIYAAN
jgi:hypothetical protein